MLLGPSNTTGKVDSAFIFIVVCCVILLAVVTICMVVFLIKYNRERHPRPERVKESALLEVIWTVVPTILVIFMFYFGWVNFEFIRNPPKDALTVNVTARQWSWLFTYDNGRQEGVLNVPVGRPVKLLMTSVDVLHCLFIPAYRIKEDCVPGMTTHLWFTANEPGTYDIFCTEYCGVGHSHMRSQVVVHEARGFPELVQRGARENRRRTRAENPPGERVSGMPFPGRVCESRPHLQGSSGAEGGGGPGGQRKGRLSWTRPSSVSISWIPGPPPSRVSRR